MSELKATPGPWKYSPSKGKVLAMITGGGRILALFKRDPNPYNAYLMEAAPELYEALEALLETCHAEPHGQSERRAAIAALAKARGES